MVKVGSQAHFFYMEWKTSMGKQEQGVDHKRYQVIPRTLIFITRENKEVLLIQGASDKKIWANRLNGIGGHVERGEDVKTSARREIMEETGLSKGDLILRGIIMIDVEPNVGICLYLFLGKSFEGEIKESNEGKLRWVKTDEISKHELVPDLYQLMPRVVNDERIIFGKYFYEGEKFVMDFIN